MCDGPGQPASVTEALAMLDRALDHLNTADAASLPSGVQAEVLRALERVEAKHTAARARVLAAFAGQAAYEDDGQGSAQAWLGWQTRITRRAAAGAVGWARRLGAHPVIASALAAGDLSESWARQLCEWTDRLPADKRDDADEILSGAARSGADLAGLGGLAEEMYQRSAGPDDRADDGFDERYLRLGITFRGAGRAEGDLTPGCAAALSAVLESLGKKAGPEDVRTAAQRRHDALEEACRRLIASGMLPGRAGQPTQIQVYMTLAQLRGMRGGSEAEAAWLAAQAAQPGWLTGPEADAAGCDATIIPIVTGQVDWAALERLTEVHLASRGLARHAQPATTAARMADGAADRTRAGAGEAAGAGPWQAGLSAGPLSPHTRQRLSRALLALAVDALSGPAGLAADLRAGLDHRPLISPSLPLDIGAATETIPSHLRRAVTARHRHCAFPGCRQPASVCDIHHIVPRSRGGPTALWNLAPLCLFHHLIAVHRWGWTLLLRSDGTITATSLDGTRTLHDHGPPRQAA